METVAVALAENSYSVYIAAHLLPRLAEHIGEADRWFVLTDENVDLLYGRQLDEVLQGLPYHKMILAPGEPSKNFRTVADIIDAMAAAGLTRRSKLLAFGGGVTGDLGGFCASVYMRGIPVIQVPTTLLAQVDSSVGGKTGVNVTMGKNLAGTFYQPETVICDTALLGTLPEREYIAGLGEVIKYGIVCDSALLSLIEARFAAIYSRDFELLDRLIACCCRIKAEITARDEKEGGLRKKLNFGHTIGHALEAVTGYRRYRHGEAVLIGMHYETLLARRLGLLDAAYGERISRLIGRTGLSLELSGFSAAELLRQMKADKKNNNGDISFILPTGRGETAEILLAPQELLGLLFEIMPAGNQRASFGFRKGGELGC